MSAHRAELSLLSDDLGWFHRLCADYHLPGVRFDRSHIHVMRDAHGLPMNDIRTPADNRAAADFITAQVRAITADPACALHASIAGGRKTMGFYLGYALSLFGRAQGWPGRRVLTTPSLPPAPRWHRPTWCLIWHASAS